MHLIRTTYRRWIALGVAMSFALVLAASAQAGQAPATTITVKTLVPTGLPLAFDSASVTSEVDFQNRGMLKYRVTSKAGEDLTSVEVGYVVFRADKSVRAGGFKAMRMRVPAGSWFEIWTLLDSEVRPGDQVVVSLNGAASETTSWAADRLAIAGAAKAVITGGPATVPAVRATAVKK